MALLMKKGSISPYLLIAAPLIVIGLSACDSERRTDIIITEPTVSYRPVMETMTANPVVAYSPKKDAMTDIGNTYSRTMDNAGSNMVAPGVVYGTGNYHDPSRPIR